MTLIQFFRKTALFIVFLCTLSSCQAANTPTNTSKVDENNVNITPYPSVYDVFACVPSGSALVAAHRGTVKNTNLPENALASLQSLHEHGVQFAEIDVARLKDNTHILFHDGVWEKRSTGKGPLATSTWSYAETLLLKNTNSKITAIRPSTLKDVLDWAKDRIYLEIDFKSTASPKTVINMIERAGMTDQVILIAYTTQQAIDLHTLAPNAMISVSILKPGDIRALEARGLPVHNMAAWVGGKVDTKLLARLRENNIPVLMASFFDLDNKLQKTKSFNAYKNFAGPADLIVSDFAFDTQETLDSYKDYKKLYAACLEDRLAQ